MGKIIISTTSDANGNAIAKFKARYRATQKDPTVGSANADSTFIVTYD